MNTQKQTRNRKYSREDPSRLKPRRISPRDLEIIDIINRYRFIPTSQLVRLIDGDIRSTEARLPHLYLRGYINRFAFPTSFHPGEFNYFLDYRKSLDLLKENGWPEKELHYRNVANNRSKNFDFAFDPEFAARHGRLSQLSHELMISRFHYMLERASRNPGGFVELTVFLQGSDVWNDIEMASTYVDKEANVVEQQKPQKTSNRPDAFFGLRFPSLPEDSNQFFYFYEADRGTMGTKTMLQKFRNHFHYIVRQKRDVEDYGVKRIKAVLIESTSHDWTHHLRRGARHEIVSGRNPTRLFWFASSEPFEEKIAVEIKGRAQEAMRFLDYPELVFRKIWSTPTHTSEDALKGNVLSLIPGL